MATGRGMGSSVPVLLKFVELVVAVCCLGLVIHPLTSMKLGVPVSDSALAYVTFCSCIIINAVILIGHGLGEFMPKRTLIIFSMILGALFIAAGGILIDDWRKLTMRLTLIPPKTPMDTLITSGVMAIFNGIICFVDVGLTIKFTE